MTQSSPQAPTPLDKLAAHYGIFSSFKDLDNKIQSTSVETKLALLRGNGIAVDDEAQIAAHLLEIRADNARRRFPQEIIITAGQSNQIFNLQNIQWAVELENGENLSGKADGKITLPNMISGIHKLIISSAKQIENITLICTPKSAPSIQQLTGKTNIWGINTALYALNSHDNYGIGNFDNLAVAAKAFAAQGADFIGINPVHAIGWVETVISPYSPSHRAFLNTAYIALDTPKKPMNDAESIDYSLSKSTHQQALEVAFAAATLNADFHDFCAASGEPLNSFALYEAISELHGSDWRLWPRELQSCNKPAVQRLKTQLAKRIEFHKWLQYMANKQLSNVQTKATEAGMKMGLYLDLAVGSRRGGAEAWSASDAIAKGVSIGAPPDHLSPAGQNWGLVAYAPAKLKATKYQALRQSLAAAMRHAAVLRIDHVLGMNRSYWLPDNGAAGGYIKQPFDSILAIIAIEAERANTAVVGEDLGLVPDGFRQTMRSRGLYSYSVLQYDKDEAGDFKPHSQLDPQTLACFSTHDTPTLKGFYQATDIAWWQKLAWIEPKDVANAKQQRQYEIDSILTTANQPKSCDYASFRDGINQILATSPATMVAVQSDDIFEQAEAANLPGTIDEHPNWRRRHAILLKNFATDIKLENIGNLMRKAKRGI